MRFIRLLLANQNAYIFLSNDKGNVIVYIMVWIIMHIYFYKQLKMNLINSNFMIVLSNQFS